MHGSQRLEIRNFYITVSLSEPYNDYCYKLVAAMFLPGSENLYSRPRRRNLHDWALESLTDMISSRCFSHPP